MEGCPTSHIDRGLLILGYKNSSMPKNVTSHFKDLRVQCGSCCSAHNSKDRYVGGRFGGKQRILAM
jgi:hypothetical protein